MTARAGIHCRVIIIAAQIVDCRQKYDGLPAPDAGDLPDVLRPLDFRFSGAVLLAATTQMPRRVSSGRRAHQQQPTSYVLVIPQGATTRLNSIDDQLGSKPIGGVRRMGTSIKP